MKKARHQNEFGRDVSMFCAEYALRKKELAEMAGVDVSAMLKAGKGIRSGVRIIPRVEAVMDEYRRASGEGR